MHKTLSAGKENAAAEQFKLFGMDPEFNQAVYEFFARERSGHLAKFVTSGKAFSLWEEFTQAAMNYPFHSDKEIIAKNSDLYGHLAKPVDGDGRVAVIELGPGSKYAITNKTLPFLKAVKANTYLPVDISYEPIMTSLEMAGEENPGIIKDFRKANFYTDDFETSVKLNEEKNGMILGRLPEGKRVFIIFGLTYGNMEGFPDDPLPKEKLVGALKNIRRYMRKGDIFIAGFDLNADEEGLNSFYGHPLNQRMVRTVLERAAAEVPNIDLARKLGQFSQWGKWIPSRHLFALGVTATDDVSGIVMGHKVGWNKGDTSSFTNAYKYPAGFLDDVIRESELKCTHIIPDERKWVHHYVMEPA